MSAVDGKFSICVGISIRAGKLHEGAGGAVAATGDLDLHAGGVVFWLVDVRAVNA